MGDTVASFGYLTLLLLAIGGWWISSNRPSIGKTLQMALVWGMIFMGGMAIYGLWNDISSDYSAQITGGDAEITIPRSRDGHYYAKVKINDVDINFLVDTGASDLVLTREDAKKVGINVATLPFLGSANTANGTVPIAYARLAEVRFGSYIDRAVPASVSGGEMVKSLLGMSYLGLFDRIEILSDRLVLYRK